MTAIDDRRCKPWIGTKPDRINADLFYTFFLPGILLLVGILSILNILTPYELGILDVLVLSLYLLALPTLLNIFSGNFPFHPHLSSSVIASETIPLEDVSSMAADLSHYHEIC